jgi:hypothetical protein
MSQILLDNRGHRHTKSRREVLHRHGLLLTRIHEQMDQTPREVFCVSGLIKLDCHFFTLRHLAEIWKIRAGYGHSVCAGQMRNAATARRRRVRHNGDRGTLEKVWQLIFMHVAGEFN